MTRRTPFSYSKNGLLVSVSQMGKIKDDEIVFETHLQLPQRATTTSEITCDASQMVSKQCRIYLFSCPRLLGKCRLEFINFYHQYELKCYCSALLKTCNNRYSSDKRYNFKVQKSKSLCILIGK